MRVMGIGMKKADSHSFHVCSDQAACKTFKGGFIQRHQNLALRRQALAQREPQGARRQRHRPVDHQVIVIETLFVALLKNIAEAFSGDERRPGALAFDQGIGGERRAMNEHAHILGLNA